MGSVVDSYLFGIKHSNRDFSDRKSWGKNQFNTSFPAALTCYMYDQDIKPVYVVVDKNLDIMHRDITQKDLLGCESFDDIFFSFEDAYDPFSLYSSDRMPRIDLVLRENKSRSCLNCLEIKLTALPDNTTCMLNESQWGSELVIRPDTVVYLSCLMASKYPDRNKLRRYLLPLGSIADLTKVDNAIKHIDTLVSIFDQLIAEKIPQQQSYILQPIWRTRGKEAVLMEDCFDVYVWSDLAFTRLFVDKIKSGTRERMTRPIRTLVWIIKMLDSYALTGKISYKQILATYNYQSQTDKSFAISGRETNKYMSCARLVKPSISKNEIRNIIKGNAHKFLSPERRLDALLFYTKNLLD